MNLIAGNHLLKMAASIWRAVPCSRRQLRLDTVLLCGQSFRWHECSPGEWLGVVADRVWRLKQDETHLCFQVYGHSTDCQLDKDTVSCEIKAEPEIKEEKSESLNCRKRKLSFTSKTSQDDVKVAQLKVENPVCDSTVVPGIKVELEDGDSDISILQDYFQLNVDVDSLYRQWSRADPYFKKMAADFWGIRILRQDPVENLFSFICSSNNNIVRITSMVEKLCLAYGQPIAEVDGKQYHSFPGISSMAQAGVEEKLRALGFGYRAKYIATSAKYIMDNHGEQWVSSLRQSSYEEAKAKLMKLCGVGAKVADCVCLMSLDKTGAIPVDTHVWQFAVRHYLPKLQTAKSVTDKLYKEIGDHFRSLWGDYAGWAQSVLFTSELRHMQNKKSSPDKDETKTSAVAKKKRQKRTVD